MSEIRRLSPEEIAEQRRGSTRIAPGIWADKNGALHFSVPELLALFGWEDTPATRDEVRAILHQIIREQFPGTPITDQE